jgi:hypothetical protein
MTFNTLRLYAPRRAPIEPTRVYQDRSLAYVLWLLMFLVFAPMIGVHVAFALSGAPAEAQTVGHKSGSVGKHG